MQVSSVRCLFIKKYCTRLLTVVGLRTTKTGTNKMNINPFIELIAAILDLYSYVLVFYIILSWLTSFGVINRFNPAVAKVSEILYKATEPVLRKIRRHVPDLGGIDISPIVVFLGIWFIKRVLFTYFYR